MRATLSGGQKRRLDLGLGRRRPELIFLDEPTTASTRAPAGPPETIRNLRPLGKTVLLTTHYLDEAEQLADRVAVLRGGEIVREGAPRELDRRSAATEIRYRRNGHERRRATRRPDAPAERADRARHWHAVRGSRGSRSPADPRGGLPGADRRVRLFLHEVRAEQFLFWRNREAAFFTFLLPMIFLLIFGSIYGNQTITKERIRAARSSRPDYWYGVAVDRVRRARDHDGRPTRVGVLKRIRVTPLPAPSYLLAVLLSTSWSS